MLHTTDITTAVGRQLKCQDPWVVTKYNQFLVKVIKQEQLIQKIQEAKSDIAQENQEDTGAILEQLDWYVGIGDFPCRATIASTIWVA